jgi:hypothetical protein
MYLGRRVFSFRLHLILLALISLCPSPGSAQFTAGTMIKFRKGYFVISMNTTRGNLGGLAGANSFCLSDLTTYNWMGKPSGTLNAAKVRAFLCDGTTCQNPMPNQYYQFASSGAPADGGTIFKTDSSGRGPGDTMAWGGAAYFNAPSGYFWTNRAVGSATLWGTTPASASTSLTCNNWTTNTGSQSVGGDPSMTNSGRWNDTIPAACNTQWYLVCMVDP